MKLSDRFPAAALLRVTRGALALVLALAPAFPVQAAGEADDTCVECARRQRKVLEALQAWRRAHDGEYPRFLRELEDDGFITPENLVCPAMARELAGGSSHHGLITARGPKGDLLNVYEYELAPSAVSMDKAFHRNGKAPTRRDIKNNILRRPGWEQVPILRCSGHRTSAPEELRGDKPFRNLRTDGCVFWSGELWERVWRDQVPATARGAICLQEGSGPPFHSGKTPPEGSLDLRPWVNASPRTPWWWGSDPFNFGPNIPDLKIFIGKSVGQSLRIGDWSFFVDGIVQTQGRPRLGEGMPGWSFANALSFPYERKGLRVERKIRRAAWLQGTAWSAKQDDMKTADLVWRYEDGTSCEVPIVFLMNVWRFSVDRRYYLERPSSHPPPAMCEDVIVTGEGDQRADVRYMLWTQVWENPKPDVPVKTLDLIGNSNCTAGLFIAAISVE